MYNYMHGQLYYICNFCKQKCIHQSSERSLSPNMNMHYICVLPTDVSNRYDKVFWVHSQGGGVVPSEWWLVGVLYNMYMG